MELYRTNLKKHYEQLIESQYLLQEVFGVDTVTALKTEAVVVKKGRDIKEKFAEYVGVFTQERFEHLRQLFSLDTRNYESLTKLKNEGKNQTGFIGSMLREGLGVSYKKSKRGRLNEVEYEEWSLDTAKMKQMVETYKPKSVQFGTGVECLIVENSVKDCCEW